MGRRRGLLARGLRGRARAVLRRLDPAHRRGADQPSRLSPAPARPPLLRASRRRGETLPLLLPARRAGPGLTLSAAAREPLDRRALVELQVDGPDHGAPFRHLRLQELGRLPRRVADGVDAELQQLVPEGLWAAAPTPLEP